MSNNSHLTKEALESVGIYELREIARDFGVKSPTTKKREELCELILKISNGEIAPQDKKSKGRPPKSVSSVSHFINENFPDELIKLKNEFSFDNEFVSKKFQFAQDVSFKYDDNEENIITGYLRRYLDKYYLMQKRGFEYLITYVPKTIIDKYNLKVGDKLTGTYSLSNNEPNCSILNNVKMINNSSNFNRQKVEINAVKFTNDELEFLNFKFKKGSRNLINFKNINEACESIIPFIDKNKEDLNYIIVSGEMSPENLYYIKSRNNVDSFLSQFGDDVNEIYSSIEDAINYSISLLSEGKKIVLVLLDVINLVNNLDMMSNKENLIFKNHNINSIQILKKLIGLGRFINEKTYLTTISVIFENQKNNELIEEFKNNLFNSVIQ